jgi:lipopolysaccharide/colanic/teichoic acid biosynthesis glycosyltransferase
VRADFHAPDEDAAITVPSHIGVTQLEGRASEWIRRSLDIAIAVSALVVGAPLLALIAIAVRLDSPGPAIFRQTRVGRDGKPFTFHKLRGMFVDARERWPDLYAYDYSKDEIDGLYFHPSVDPRVTSVGRFLRRTSLDELLNFWNVLRGDMAIVGPRPEIPEMIPYYGQAASVVLSVKPGVTSLAKVTGRDELTFAETLRFDLEYVRRRSLALDLKIIGATVLTVVRQRGVLGG